MRRAILIIDFDSYKVQAKVIEEETGISLCSFRSRFDLIHPKENYLEADPERIWNVSCDCVRMVRQMIGSEAEICALSFSFTGEGLFVLDSDGNPLINEILLADKRAVNEGRELQAKFTTPTARFSHLAVASKVLYLKRNCPEIFDRAKMFVSLQQFILMKLGLEPVWDRTMASCHSFYGMRLGDWKPEVVEAAGITKDRLGGRILNSYEVIGTVRKYGDVEFGRAVNVIPGGHDGDIGMLGLGITDPSAEAIGEVAGSYDHVGFITKVDVSKLDSLHRHPGPYDGTCVVMKAYPEYYSVAKWFMREIVGKPTDAGFEEMWAASEFDGKTTLVHMDPHFHDGKGAFFGLNINLTKHDMFKSMMEALTFENRRLIESVIDDSNQTCTSVRIGGDAASSDAWMQLKADVSGLTVSRMINNDISAVGASILAAYGSGTYESIDEAITTMTSVRDTHWPDMTRHARYNKLYRNYLSRYPHPDNNVNPWRYV